MYSYHWIAINSTCPPCLWQILGRYRSFIRKLKDSRREAVLKGLPLRYDVGSVTLSRMVELRVSIGPRG